MSCHAFIEEAPFSLEEIRKVAESNRLLTLEIEFSQRCNFRCPYCYMETSSNPREMTVAEGQDVLLQAKALGARKIVILGGEPMIYPEIMQQIRFIRAQDMAVEVFTNGTNITAERAQALADLDVKVVLKMNSMDREKQNTFCGREDAYDIIQAAFTHLKDAGYGGGGKSMAVSSVICRENIDELESLWCWLREQDIDPYLEMITPQGQALNSEWVYADVERIETLFERLAEIDKSRFDRHWTPQPPLVGDCCLRHQFSCCVNAFGDVLPCVGITITTGNIRQEKLAHIIETSEVMQDLRHFKDHMKGPCATCDKHAYCYGCRGTAYQMTGDYMESDPLCWRLKDRKSEIDVLPMSAVDLIPQASPMRFVDTLKAVGDRSGTVETVVASDCPFLDEQGYLLETAFIEIMAQACAAHNGFRNRHRTNGSEGYLLGAKKVSVLGRVRKGDRLTTTLRKEAKLGDFGIISSRVYRGSECVARGEIKVYDRVKESV